MNLKKTIFLILLLILSCFFSCEKPFKKTQEVIDRDKFVNVMTDFYLYKNIPHSIIGKTEIDYDEVNGYILQKHQISSKQFNTSFNYYMLDKNLSKTVYKEVKENLKEIAPNFVEPKIEEDKSIKKKN